jgi:hypothetical protein
MASLNVNFTGHWNSADLGFGIGTGARLVDPRQALTSLDGFLWALVQGAQAASFQIVTSGTNAVAASSDVTATTSGNLGTVINGTTVTTTFTTSQDGTATQAVADINANTTVNKWVTATKGATGHFTVTANIPGALGNCVTLTVTGTGAAATGSGKLAGGAGADGQPVAYSVG